MPPLVQRVFLLLNCRRLMRMVLKRVERGIKDNAVNASLRSRRWWWSMLIQISV